MDEVEQLFTDREQADPAFREAWDREKPWHEFRLALIQARHDRGLNQRDMAELLGIQQPALVRLERGAVKPTVETLAKIAGALDLTFEILPTGLRTVPPKRRRPAPRNRVRVR